MSIYLQTVILAVQFSAVHTSGQAPSSFIQLDSLLQAHIDKKDVAGIEALVFQNERVSYHKTFGWKDIEKKEPMSKDGIFRMMSMTQASPG